MDEVTIAERLVRIETKVDVLVGLASKDDVRISAVEKKVWYGSGALGICMIIAAKLSIWPH